MEMRSVIGYTAPYLMKYPSGRWGFVGAVPLSLAFIHKDGSEVSSEDAAKVASFGIGLFPTIKPRSWETAQDAMNAAQAIGYHAASVEDAQYKGLVK